MLVPSFSQRLAVRSQSRSKASGSRGSSNSPDERSLNIRVGGRGGGGRVDSCRLLDSPGVCKEQGPSSPACLRSFGSDMCEPRRLDLRFAQHPL